MRKYRLVILFSGNGSNMEALFKALNGFSSKDFSIEIPIVFTNNPQAYGIKRAENLGVRCELLSHRGFSEREEFDCAVLEILKPYQPDFCLLAGYMRILSPIFLESMRVINIHPSILPLFKGANAIQESFESDMQVAGVSVHHVNQELDSGKIIAQEAFCREDSWQREEFEAKIHEIEHRLYPKAVLKVLQEHSSINIKST
ncbi:phosphoribosylglycinamide formyltransferase [Helicobacter monodelphidis]|nr:phosphoribosylglycinamide formyltransferase [Helicobacter sp. 15-1451]